jgi:hypothetical protein
MCEPAQHTLRLKDDERGVDALLSVSAATPGCIQIRVLRDNQFVKPTLPELQKLRAHPDLKIVQLNLILIAIDSWPSWAALAEEVLLDSSLSPPAGDIS